MNQGTIIKWKIRQTSTNLLHVQVNPTYLLWLHGSTASKPQGGDARQQNCFLSCGSNVRHARYFVALDCSGVLANTITWFHCLNRASCALFCFRAAGQRDGGEVAVGTVSSRRDPLSSHARSRPTGVKCSFVVYPFESCTSRISQQLLEALHHHEKCWKSYSMWWRFFVAWSNAFGIGIPIQLRFFFSEQSGVS